MPCVHRFSEYLNLERLDFAPTTLIVGTFNPSWPNGNNARWFYGRTHDTSGNKNNNFWEVLPRLYQQETLINANPNDWKLFCKEKRIAITDLIWTINDAKEDCIEHNNILRKYSDNDIAIKFNHHITNDIVSLLRTHNTIKNIYLTRGIGVTFWRRLWRPVMQYANQNDIYEARLLTPSTYAFYQQGRYNRNNPENRTDELADFIFEAWKDVWHE
jgi:hypothetical protein